MNACLQIAVVCANCAARKGETNHWFVLVPTRQAATSQLLEVWPFDIQILEESDAALAVCGRKCLLEQIEKVVSA
jgi:hypothetical protein